MSKIKIAIIGYGNLGRGVEISVAKNPDMELVGIFTRRDPSLISTAFSESKCFLISEVLDYADLIDVAILCGGSKDDLPTQTPHFAKYFHTVDSFDTHAKIPEFFEAVDKVAKPHNKVAIIAAGWDPGMFSINRVISEAILPDGETYTFWGKGLSQGHSDAVRRVEGVRNGVQYTLPSEVAMEAVRAGKMPTLATKDKHTRECFVVLENGADAVKVANEIRTMPNYFADYETTVNFITEEELAKNHSKMPHGGFVIRSAKSSPDHTQTIEYSLKLESNPEFTASVLVACARAAFRFASQKCFGAKTVFDIPPAYFSPKTDEELRRDYL